MRPVRRKVAWRRAAFIACTAGTLLQALRKACGAPSVPAVSR